jgi:hypothetical protein
MPPGRRSATRFGELQNPPLPRDKAEYTQEKAPLLAYFILAAGITEKDSQREQ